MSKPEERTLDSHSSTGTPLAASWYRFEFRGHSYLLVVDYYSRFIEIARLDCTTSEEIILQTKKIFARYGIVEVVVSDNRPLYSSEAYAAFARQF